eukprot:1190088-Pleurochrysis_carterae.AAC.1
MQSHAEVVVARSVKSGKANGGFMKPHKICEAMRSFSQASRASPNVAQVFDEAFVGEAACPSFLFFQAYGHSIATRAHQFKWVQVHLWINAFETHMECNGLKLRIDTTCTWVQ